MQESTTPESIMKQPPLKFVEFIASLYTAAAILQNLSFTAVMQKVTVLLKLR